MRITKAHAEYWTARKCPKFMAHLFEPRGKGMMRVEPVDVNDLINAQQEPDIRSNKYKISNTLNLARSNRRRGTMIEWMMSVATKPGDHNKHDVHCRRWLRRMGFLEKPVKRADYRFGPHIHGVL